MLVRTLERRIVSGDARRTSDCAHTLRREGVSAGLRGLAFERGGVNVRTLC